MNNQLPNVPQLILIAGLPGTGKSTVAKAYIQQYGGVHINSDLLRNTMKMRGHYDPTDKEKVYNAMLESTWNALEEGKNAIVDSTFISEQIRATFEAVAHACSARFYWVEMHASEETIRERLLKPRPDSEADFSVYQTLRDINEPITQPHLDLWSDKMSMEDMAACIHNFSCQLSL